MPGLQIVEACYLAPEMHSTPRGHLTFEQRVRADAWAVGALLVVLLTGEVPFAHVSEQNGFDDLPTITQRVQTVRCTS